MTIPQPIRDLDTNWYQKQLFQIKLFLRLFRKSGFLFQASYVFFSVTGVVVYIIAPDMVPGVLDDLFVAPWLIPWVLSKAWVAFLPPWFVQKHQLALEKELQTKPTPPPPPKPHAQPASRKTTTPPTAAKPIGPIVVIHHTNDGQTTVFHFTQAVVKLLKEKTNLSNKLSNLGELKDANLLVDLNKEAEVIAILSNDIEGLQVRYAKKR